MIALARRRTELGLIILGSMVTISAYALAALGKTATLPVDLLPFLGLVLGLLLAAHLATRRLAPGADPLLLPLAALLNGIGYVFIARLDEAAQDEGSLAGLQAVWTGLGIGAFIVTLLVVRRARDLQAYKYIAMVVGVGLLLLPLVPMIGKTLNGARIWVEIGPVGFQPGEFAKIALAIFFAAYLADNRELLGLSAFHPKYLGPVFVAWGASLLVMFYQRDLGSSLLFFALFVVLLWVATGRALYLVAGGALFFGGAALAYNQFAHVQQRVSIWLDPWQDPTDDGFQVVQSWFALAWGGIGGTGLGLGNPDRIPVVETDFIFAAIGEELGLLGTTAVIVAFLLLIAAGFRVALTTDDPFEKLLATGLTTLLGLQAFIIMAGVTRLLPLTGVTLPFVSYGGSSLLGNYILLALLVRISDDSARRRWRSATPQSPGAGVGVNTQIRRLGIGLLACYLALFAMVNYVQLGRAEELNDDPRNTRAIVRDFDRDRGEVLTADGVVIARTVPAPPGDQFEFQREFPTGDLFAHVGGFLNFNFGADGIEREYNDDLAGQTTALHYQTLSDFFIDRSRVGDVTITLRNDLQQLARDALGERRGSVVALDPRDGSILTMWSFPSYDPNPLSSHDAAVASAARAALEPNSQASPLIPAAYRRSFPPGSTFKVVTASTGVELGLVTPTNPDYPVVTEYDIDFTDDELSNFGGQPCGGTLFVILARSCNTAFAEMGDDTIGAGGMVDGAQAFGFNERTPLDLPAPAASTFPTDFPANQGNGPLARASIGQGDVSATPLQMALVAAAVANGGSLMTPHVLGQVTDDRGDVVRRFDESEMARVLSPPAAETMREAMVGVVENGSGTNAQISGFVVGGKTGTAQVGSEPPSSHAWFIAFAGPPGEPAEVAVAVLVEAQPGVSEVTGGRVAAPIARSVMEAVLNLPD